MMRHWQVGLATVLGLVVLPMVAWAGGAPTWVQDHYRWRNDDGSESAATWKAAADTAITGITRGQNIRLRFSASNTGAASGTLAGTLEYSASTSGPWTAVGTDGRGITAFEMTATANCADGAATTALLAGTGTFAAGKAVESPNNSSAAVTVNTNQYSNFEYCFKATPKARGSTVYYFRMSNAGTALTTYSKTAQLTMVAGEANEAPVIKSALTAQASVVAPFSYQILASGSEPITYGASGLPAGLTLGAGTISGTPAEAGIFSVGLSASSAYGADSKTLVLTVFANQPPAASNQALSVDQAGEVQINLAWTDPDTPALTNHTFMILTQPSHGTVMSYGARYPGNDIAADLNYRNVYYYTADGDFAGTDVFTWKCRDVDNYSNIATCTVTVATNIAPVAFPSGPYTVNGETYCAMSYSHVGTGQTLTFELVRPPLHGAVSISGSSARYTPSERGYMGSDSFTWRCNDGVTNSNVATVTLTVPTSPPAPLDQTVYVLTNVATILPAYYGGGGGYTCTAVRLTSAKHGTVAVTNGTSFLYVPTPGYMGPDSFAWSLNYGLTSPTSQSATVTCSIWVQEPSVQNDWPTFRGNAYRSAGKARQLPSNLSLQWIRELPAGIPAWKAGVGANRYFNIDAGHEPIVAGGRLFVGSNRDDSLSAYSTATGAELWRFFADGPVRMAPLASGGKVYFASDDGQIYCLNAADGSLVWKRMAVSGDGTTRLARRKVFGNGRMISSWPVRGGLMLTDARLYFASGIWTVDGVFAGALDPGTGATVWMYEKGIGRYSAADAFVPQGYLVRSALTETFYAPSSKNVPLNCYLVNDLGLELAAVKNMAGHGRHMGSGWTIDCYGDAGSQTEFPKIITAGSVTYTATTVAGLGVAGTVHTLLAGDDRLFVVTRASGDIARIYCFGGTNEPSPVTWRRTVTPLANTNDAWTAQAVTILSSCGGGVGVGLVMGIGSGRLADELIKQSQMHVIVIDPSASKVQAFRARLVAAGLYGSRASAFVAADALDCGLPPYIARLVASEDPAAIGFPADGALGTNHVQKLIHSVRPYGGQVWLPTSAAGHTGFANSISAAGVAGFAVARNGGYSVLTRVGKLPGAIEWSADYGVVTNSDQVAKGPFGVLWYGDTIYSIHDSCHGSGSQAPEVKAGSIVSSTRETVDVYSGIVGGQAASWSDIPKRNFLGLTDDTPFLPRRNPLFGVRELGERALPGGPDGNNNYGRMMTGQGGTTTRSASIYCEEVGTLNLSPKISCTGADHIIPANGVVSFSQMMGCGCDFTPETSLALVHDDDAENFCQYGYFLQGAAVQDDPIRKLGVNFGALSEHKGTDGRLWIHQPRYSVTDWYYTVPITPTNAHWYNHHSVRMKSSEGPKWVTASGLRGAAKIRIPVAWPVTARWNAAAPAVDGDLSDPCWDGTDPAMIAYERFDANRDVNRPTGIADQQEGEVYVRYDGANLYIGGLVRNPGLTNDSANSGWVVYLADRKGLSAAGPRKFLALALDPNGARRSYTGTLSGQVWSVPSTVTNGWIGTWTAAMVWTGKVATVEYSIPWSTLAKEGFDRSSLLFNMGGPGTTFITSHDKPFSWNSAYKFVPLFLDSVTGPLGPGRAYTVKLHFAETEGALAGERRFDVKLQGQTVLQNFDIFSSAGGADRGIVRTFSNIMVGNELVVELEAKAGETLISGVELDAEFASQNHPPILCPRPDLPLSVPVGSTTQFKLKAPETLDPDGDALSYAWKLDGMPVGANTNLFNYKPLLQTEVGEHVVTVAVSDGRGGVTSNEWTFFVTGSNSLPDLALSASATVGGVPFVVNFDASGCVDTNGTIAGYAWNYGDGTTGTGVTASHTFGQPGSYNVRLTVTDNAGAKCSTNVMIYAMAPRAPTIFSPLSVMTTRGTPFSYTIIVGGTEPVTFGASGLPAGLFRSGPVISGTPASAGTYNVTLTASNSGGTETKMLVLRVENQVLTSIVVVPGNVVVRAGATQSFAASGLDQIGLTMLSQPGFGWTASGGGTITASGLFTAGSVEGGPHLVTASGGGIIGAAQVTVLNPQTYYWETGVTGLWLAAENWIPGDITNAPTTAGWVADGTALASSTPFQGKLTIGAGGELMLTNSSATVSNGVCLAGGRLRQAGATARTLTANLDAAAGTISRIQVDGSAAMTMTHSGNLTGTGTLLVSGTGIWQQTSTTASGFNGRMEITDGQVRLRSGTQAYGDSGTISVNSGGVLLRGDAVAAFTIRGGIFLNGGKYRDHGNSGTTWSWDTPWTVQTNSTIDTAEAGGYADIVGPLHGNGDLVISRAAGAGNCAVTLRGTNSTYSGMITVAATPTNAFLFLGNSTALPANGSLAGLVIEQAGTNRSVVTVGARKIGATVTDIPNVTIKVRSLTVGGVAIPVGLYSQANPVPAVGFVAFNNASSSLQVTGYSPPANPDLDMDGMPDAWETSNFGSTSATNGAPQADADGDGMSNLQEYIAGT
ncbi:MAG: hypothetical protein C0404_09570, partial [Verrucomicrobia bacterium]|nr:hypothetical protein [Verrucomicrobiota bacterium]